MVDIQRDYRYIPSLFSMIQANIDTLRLRIASACDRAGRSSADVALVAVSKTFPSAAIRQAVEAGVEEIGENYVQELLGKRKDLAGLPIRWHFIGHLQSNKVKYVAPWVELIHAVDNAGLAREIDRPELAHTAKLDVSDPHDAEACDHPRGLGCYRAEPGWKC